MATIEERIVYDKAREMEPDKVRVFLKGVESRFLWDELRRRETIKDEIIEMAGEISRRVLR